MGAVYNRQNLKAVVHFMAVVGLFQFAGLNVAPAVFTLCGIVAYIYSIIDSYRTAQLIAQGESPAANEEQFKRSLARHAPAIGLVLIFIGAVIVARTIWLVSFATMARIFPVFLIILGGYLLTRYFKRSGNSAPADDYSRQQNYPLLPDRYEEKSTGNVRHMTRPGGR
jgi:Ca2+/Na+ antiporter